MSSDAQPPAAAIIPSDALARAMLTAFADSETLGLALLRGADGVHVFANRTYERVLGSGSVLGRPAHEVLPAGAAPPPTLAAAATGLTSTVPEVLVHASFAAGGSGTRVYASFTYLRAPKVDGDENGLVVLVRDVSADVHERRMTKLFTLLASDFATERDEDATIRTAVANASSALEASAASIFLLNADRKSLTGAIVGWDWTRTSFVADIAQWPSVQSAIAKNEALYFTADDAREAEQGWFERRGIKGAICAPMAADGQVLGVLFFDYAAQAKPRVDLGVAKSVADQCASLVERAALRRPPSAR